MMQQQLFKAPYLLINLERYNLAATVADFAEDSVSTVKSPSVHLLNLIFAVLPIKPSMQHTQRSLKSRVCIGSYVLTNV